MVSVLWFRRSLRLSDNEALTRAVAESSTVVCAFVLPDPAADDPTGAAARSWLRRSLLALDSDLRTRGSSLVLRSGPAASALPRLATECSANAVHCQRDWTPSGLAEEELVGQALAGIGVDLRVSEGELAVQPDALVTGAGTPYRVFTPFWNAWRPRARWGEPLPAPDRIPSPALAPATAGPPAETPGVPDVDRWWEVGEQAAHRRLTKFVREGMEEYPTYHDRPDIDGTSRLSPHLAWGEISPRQVIAALEDQGEAAEVFLRQLAWREFSYHVLAARPEMIERPLRAEFERFPWRADEPSFGAWKAGRTGYPLVDAGMRQLAATGWMHNRVRMVSASFLTKHLLGPWQDGARYFHERLVDHDAAANAFNWQWVAGSGADATPFFRVFNPKTQAKRFDPDGAYVREWVPEIGTADYPAPIVEHAEARLRALAAWDSIRKRPPIDGTP